MMRLIAIARNAFVETIRQPVYTILVLVTFAMLVGSVPLATFSMGRGAAEYSQTDQQNMIVWGLSTLLGSGLLIAAFSAAGVLSREIEEKTILTVLSKPVSRPLIVLGKFVGVAGALAMALYICSLVFLMTVRHRVMTSASDPFDWPVIVLGCSGFVLAMLAALGCNYFFGWPYTSAGIVFKLIFLTVAMGVISFVGKGWQLVPFGHDIPPDVLIAVLLVLLCSLIFAAVAVAASTRLGQLMTLVVCVGFAVVSLWSYSLFGRWMESSLLARLAYQVWPNITFFFTMDAIIKDVPIPLSYLIKPTAYALLHITAILAIGMVLFQNLETEARASSSAPALVALLAWCFRILAVAAVLVAAALLGNVDQLLRIVASAGVLLAAAAIWMFGGYLGRGAKWAYLLALVMSAIALAGSAAAWLAPDAWGGAWRRIGSTWLVLGVVANALVLLILWLPKTRYHFGFMPKKARTRGG